MSDDDMEAARAEATRRIVESNHRLRVIVAGPGTGKTRVFKEALARAGGGLALTFIRALAADLSRALDGLAEARTFHGYSKRLLHRLQPEGLTSRFTFYPPFIELMATDLSILDQELHERGAVEEALQTLDLSTSLPDAAMRVGTYYNAASFVDVVYRTYKYLGAHPEDIPRYPLVVVDEYQDFTLLETAFIRALGQRSPLLIAGDDDQALYDFRFASPEYIRELARSSDIDPHELPYCSRCTESVVGAVVATIRSARVAGKLQDRLDKPFVCYTPEKALASAQYPKLIDARCSTYRYSYMARYVAAEIAKIPQADTEASAAGGHPTVLIVGPGQFVGPIHDFLVAGPYPQAKRHVSDELHIDPIDAYRLLAQDRRSNLGWRILVHLHPFAGWVDIIRDSIENDTPLVDRLPNDFVARHRAAADLMEGAIDGAGLDTADRRRLADALGVTPENLFAVIGISAAEGEEPVAVQGWEEGDEGDTLAERPPTILCTTPMSAKGLSAEHVFIVGMMEGHFPRSNASPTDKEIMEFLVALSRTRKAAHLVSAKVFGAPVAGRAPIAQPSIFLTWVRDFTRQLVVDKDYFRR